MSPESPRTFEYDIDVAPGDIDEMGHVNNAVYLRWVQAAVIRHWRRVAPKDAVASHLWVALRHEIRYRRPAFRDDHVVVRVVLTRLRGAKAFYATLIRRGDEVLAEVKSCWCCVDAATRRPVRLARGFVGQFLAPPRAHHHG